ncbi:hypothetical protein AB0C33_15035 [Nonomuraea sp. NPDC048881]|uniref:hypothetical protein n=1 Tax=Nonomuraea sp. NPDC048881 TaxID=3155030 RepID=UPI0033E312F4
MDAVRRAAAVLISLMIHAVTLALIALGVRVIYVNADFLFAWMIGAVLIGVGVLMCPRPPRLPVDAEVVQRSAAPELHALAETVARAMHVQPPASVAVRDLGMTCEYVRTGFRDRSLVIGLPTWLVLPARHRVALLARAYADQGHEGLIIGAALTTLTQWRESLQGGGGSASHLREEQHTRIGAMFGVQGTPAGTYEAAGSIGRVVGQVLGWPVMLLQRLLIRLVRADGGRRTRQQLPEAHAVVTDTDLRELSELMEGARFLAPVQAAALRGATTSAIRESALERASELGMDTGDAGVLTAPASSRIDCELSRHYARAIRGFGLIL